MAQYVLSSGEYPGDRMTGRSTAQALRFIANAIDNPNVPQKIEDHYGNRLADVGLGGTVCGMIEKLGLKHLHVTKVRGQTPYIVFARRT